MPQSRAVSLLSVSEVCQLSRAALAIGSEAPRLGETSDWLQKQKSPLGIIQRRLGRTLASGPAKRVRRPAVLMQHSTQKIPLAGGLFNQHPWLRDQRQRNELKLKE